MFKAEAALKLRKDLEFEVCGRLSSYYDYAPLLRECFRDRLRTVSIDITYAWTNVMHKEELASPVCHPIIKRRPHP